MKDRMTSKERWLAVLSGETPDRLPMDYWGTLEAMVNLMAHLSCSSWPEVLERLYIDAPVGVEPNYVGPPKKPGQDMYGRRYTRVEYSAGVYAECIYHPLAQYSSVEEIEDNLTER